MTPITLISLIILIGEMGIQASGKIVADFSYFCRIKSLYR